MSLYFNSFKIIFFLYISILQAEIIYKDQNSHLYKVHVILSFFSCFLKRGRNLNFLLNYPMVIKF